MSRLRVQAVSCTLAIFDNTPSIQYRDLSTPNQASKARTLGLVYILAS